MMASMSTKELEAALAWRSAALEVSVCGLWPGGVPRADVEVALAVALGDAFPRGFRSRVEQTEEGSPWFASVDATIANIDVLPAVLPGLLQRLLDHGAVAAWSGFEGSVLGEEDVFARDLATHHYAIAAGPTVAVALDDEARESPSWRAAVDVCRAELLRRIPTLSSRS